MTSNKELNYLKYCYCSAKLKNVVHEEGDGAVRSDLSSRLSQDRSPFEVVGEEQRQHKTVWADLGEGLRTQKNHAEQEEPAAATHENIEGRLTEAFLSL